MIGSTIKKIFIDKRVIKEKITQRILTNWGGSDYDVIDDNEFQLLSDRLSIAKGKRVLYITSKAGGMVKDCPATLNPYICCRYYVINQLTQCPMDCTYCILQGYLNSPVITLYTDIDEVFSNIDQLIIDQPGRLFRFGTGELTDSLALDNLTGLSTDFIQFFNDKRNTLIEFKTKSDRIENLLMGSSHNVVVSWSINPQEIVEKEEIGTCSMIKRLQAAKQCQDAGYLLGFHFDPILWIPDWESAYKNVVDQIFSVINGARIAWISLGSFRYPSQLKPIIEKRFPQSSIIYEEMITGMDGKERYPKPLRIELYKKLIDWLKEKERDLFIYLCMESSDVWNKTIGFRPQNNEDLDFLFAKSIYERFPEIKMDVPQQDVYQNS
jgi:spore photoproduct lyase